MKNIHAALLLLLLTTTLNAQIVNRFRDSTIFYNKVQFDSIIRITEGAGNGKVLTNQNNHKNDKIHRLCGQPVCTNPY